MKNNLHLFLSNVEKESRLFKETRYVISNNIFMNVTVLGLWAEGLSENEVTDFGLSIIRLRTMMRRFREVSYIKNNSALRKLLAAIGIFEYFFAALGVALKLRPTHVSCHNAILLPIAAMTAFLVGAKLVYVPHELEAERTGLTRFAKKITKLIERAMIRRCSSVVLVCEPIEAWYQSRYGISNTHVVRNLPSSVDVVVMESKPDLFRSEFLINDDKPIYIYQGVLSRERGVPELLRYFSTNDNMHLVLMGYGDMELECQTESRRFGNIHFKPAVPIGDIIKYTSSADFGVFVLSGNVSLSYEYSLPNKFFEYLHAGLPVVVSSNLTYLSRIVRESGLGVVVDNGGMGSVGAVMAKFAEEFKRNAVAYRVNCIWEHDAAQYFKIYAG